MIGLNALLAAIIRDCISTGLTDMLYQPIQLVVYLGLVFTVKMYFSISWGLIFISMILFPLVIYPVVKIGFDDVRSLIFFINDTSSFVPVRITRILNSLASLSHNSAIRRGGQFFEFHRDDALAFIPIRFWDGFIQLS